MQDIISRFAMREPGIASIICGLVSGLIAVSIVTGGAVAHKLLS